MKVQDEDGEWQYVDSRLYNDPDLNDLQDKFDDDDKMEDPDTSVIIPYDPVSISYIIQGDFHAVLEIIFVALFNLPWSN